MCLSKSHRSLVGADWPLTGFCCSLRLTVGTSHLNGLTRLKLTLERIEPGQMCRAFVKIYVVTLIEATDAITI